MKFTEHKTESICRRYAIVAELDIADRLRKVAAFPGGQLELQVGDKWGTVEFPRGYHSGAQVVEGRVGRS